MQEEKDGEAKMEDMWESTITNIDAFNWKGEPIQIKDVPAIKNTKTGKIRVDASEVANAEIRMLAEKFKLNPRDIALLMMLYAKPGPFKEGEVHYKYHLNKMLFYQWKNLEKQFGDAFPHDNFRAASKGPIPVNLWDDLKRFEKMKLVSLKHYQWGKIPKEASLITRLTPQGLEFAKLLWNEIAPELRKVTLKTKEQIFPLDPITVMKRVHREYPEYKETYAEPDRE